MDKIKAAGIPVQHFIVNRTLSLQFIPHILSQVTWERLEPMRLHIHNIFHWLWWPEVAHRKVTQFKIPSARLEDTVYPKKYADGFCFAVLCCGYTLTDFPISIRLTSNDCPSASKATLMNMDKYFMWIHYERLHNHNKVKHNKTVCIFVGI